MYFKKAHFWLEGFDYFQKSNDRLKFIYSEKATKHMNFNKNSNPMQISQIHLHKIFFFVWSISDSFLNQTAFELRKKKWGFLKSRFACIDIKKWIIFSYLPL